MNFRRIKTMDGKLKTEAQGVMPSGEWVHLWATGEGAKEEILKHAESIGCLGFWDSSKSALLWDVRPYGGHCEFFN